MTTALHMVWRGMLCVLAVSVVACEDPVDVDEGIPTEREFLEATRGAARYLESVVNPGLPRFRPEAGLASMAAFELRLRPLVPIATIAALEVEQTTSATYDTVAGHWIVTGIATSGDSLRYQYSATVAYVDTTGSARPDFVAGLTTTGSMREEFLLRFRTGDFANEDSYEVALEGILSADVRMSTRARADTDTFLVDSQASVLRRAQAAADTSRIDVVLSARGRVGPGRSSGSDCLLSTEFDVRWGRWKSSMRVNSSSFLTLGWFDPEERIGIQDRVLFTQNVPIECPR